MVTRPLLRRRPLLIGFALAFAWAAEADAHAFLEKAAPRVGSRVSTSPPEVRLWFSEGLETLFSGVTITDPAGKALAEGPVRVDGADHQQLVMSITRPLAPGLYRVRWKVVSVDSHPTQGDFTFQVGP